MLPPARIAQPARIDEQKLHELLGRAIVDFGGADIAPLVVIGDRLGLFRALAEAGPLTSAGLAAQTGTAERYVREWLNAQAASGYVTYHAETGRYSLTPEQAMAFADEDGRRSRRRFQTGSSAGRMVDKLTEAFRTGKGVGWHEHDHGCSTASSASSARPYLGNLVQAWIPALDGVEAGCAPAPRRRHRLRPRRFDDDHGAGLSGVALRRLRLAPGLD